MPFMLSPATGRVWIQRSANRRKPAWCGVEPLERRTLLSAGPGPLTAADAVIPVITITSPDVSAEMGRSALALTVSDGFFSGFLDPDNKYRFFTHTDWDSSLFGPGIEPDTSVFGIDAPAHRVDGHVTFEADGLGNTTVIESTGSFAAHPDFDLGSTHPITFGFFADTFSGPGFPPVSDTRGDFSPQFLNILSGLVEPLPTVFLTAGDTLATEDGLSTGTFTFTRDILASDPLEVFYTVGGTALAGSDFESLSGVATIPANQTSVTVTVQPLTDDDDREFNETVVLALAPGEYIQGGTGSATVTIVDTASEDPNLQIELDGSDFTGVLIAGDTLPLEAIVTNTGTQPSASDVSVVFFLLPEGQAEPTAQDTPLAREIVRGPINVSERKNIAAKGAVPAGLAPGVYKVLAVVDADGAVVETDETDNTDFLAPAVVRLGFGAGPGRDGKIKKLTVNGNTYKLTGPGHGTVIPGQNGAPDSVLIQTDGSGKAALSVKAAQGITPVLQEITIEGAARAFKAKGYEIRGGVNVTGTLKSLTVGGFKGQAVLNIDGDGGDPTSVLVFQANGIENLSINSAIPIKSIKVASWKDTDATPDTISAPWIGGVSSQGDFEADIATTDATPLNSLGTLAAKGLVSSLIRSAGSIGSVTAGRFVGARIYAAVDAGVTGLPGAGDFVAGSAAVVRNVQAKGIAALPGGGPPGAGESFVDSIIAGPSVGRVRLKDVLVDNGGNAFGIVADTSIAIVGREGAPPVQAMGEADQEISDLDFKVRIV